MDPIVKLNAQGREYFLQEDYPNALRCYAQALDVYRTISNITTTISKENGSDDYSNERPTMAALWANHSACLLRLERYADAVESAERSIEEDPRWAKAYHRKAQAFVENGEIENAIETYRQGAKAVESDQKSHRFIQKQIHSLESLPALEKVERYVQRHGTILGCKTKLSLSMFQEEELLGEGNYTTIYRATFKLTKESFALKILDKAQAERLARRHSNIHNELKMEKKLLFRLRHVNIVRLFHTFQDNSSIYFLMELASGGEVWHKLRYGDQGLVGLRPSLAQFYLAQTLLALEYLTSQGVIHRDLKPENLLISLSKDHERVERIKLIDFGTAHDLIDTELNGSNFVGTPEYMSPEAIKNQDPTPALDIWAFGCAMYQLHCGRIPFKGGSPYLTFLKAEAVQYDVPNYFAPSLRDVLSKVLVRQPGKRLNHEQLKQHEYFKDTDFDTLYAQPIVPLPTLFELGLEAIGDHLVSLSQSSKRRTKEVWSPGCLSINALSKGIPHLQDAARNVRDNLMGYLEQRMALGRPTVFPLFFETAQGAKFLRPMMRGYLGMSSQEQGRFEKPFVMVHLGSMKDADEDLIETIVRRVNTLEPKPKLVLQSGNTNMRWMSKLREDIPVVCAYPHDATDDHSIEQYNQRFGQDYYSLFVNGVLVISINSALLKKCKPVSSPESKTSDGADDDDHENEGEGRGPLKRPGAPTVTPPSDDDDSAELHAKWLERELLMGKFCSRHVVLLSYHAWTRKQTEDTENVMPEHVLHRFTKRLQEAGAQIVLASSGTKSVMETIKPSTDLEPKLRLTNTAPLSRDHDVIRILRCQGHEINTDTYGVNTLPKWLALDDESENENDKRPGEDSDDSISSFSDDAYERSLDK